MLLRLRVKVSLLTPRQHVGLQIDCYTFFKSFKRSRKGIYTFSLFSEFCTETHEDDQLLIEKCSVKRIVKGCV